MINIDSCCFEADENHIRPNIDKFTKVSREQDNTVQTYYEAKNICKGLNKITYLPDTGKVTLDISGKLLSPEHRQLISQNNIDACFDVMNATGYVDAEMYETIENNTVRKVDFTENITVPNVSEYLQAVGCITGQKYNKDIYNGRGSEAGKTGIVFRGTFKTFKEYLLFYDKQTETKDTAYRDILRLESKRTTFKSIRKDVNGDNNLYDILTSDERPVLKVYKRIAGMNATNNNLSDNMKNINSKDELLHELFLQQAGHDMQTIKELLHMSGMSRTTQYRMLKKIELYKRERTGKELFYNTEHYLNDILHKLSA